MIKELQWYPFRPAINAEDDLLALPDLGFRRQGYQVDLWVQVRYSWFVCFSELRLLSETSYPRNHGQLGTQIGISGCLQSSTSGRIDISS